MNLPPAEYVLVQEDDHLSFVSACFRKSGLEPDHAGLIARLLVNSDLRGVRSHGFRWMVGYCRLFRDGKLNTRPQVRLVHETPAAVVLDGDGTLGYMPMIRATEAAIDRARQVGVGLGLVRHIGHYGAAGHYTRLCLERGCVGFSVQGFRRDGNAASRPEKPSVAFTGAPPMSFSVPTTEQPGFVLDMVAHALSGYHAPGFEDLPERIPAAFFKSIGLVAAANLMGGALTGFTLPESDALEERWPGARMGGTILAIDAGIAAPADVVRAEADRYSRDIGATYAPMPGHDRALLPGAIEEEILARSRREGIRFGAEEQQAAQALHEDWGVALPWT